jgi:hypothetical protein
LDQTTDLADNEQDQELPKVLSVEQPGELSVLRATTEAVEGAVDHVFFIGQHQSLSLEFVAGNPEKLLPATFPDVPNSYRVAFLELNDPVRDGSRGGHGHSP